MPSLKYRMYISNYLIKENSQSSRKPFYNQKLDVRLEKLERSDVQLSKRLASLRISFINP